MKSENDKIKNPINGLAEKQKKNFVCVMMASQPNRLPPRDSLTPLCRFSPHSRKRLKEKGIPENHVEQILCKPAKICPHWSLSRTWVYHELHQSPSLLVSVAHDCVPPFVKTIFIQ